MKLKHDTVDSGPSLVLLQRLVFPIHANVHSWFIQQLGQTL